ncbi:MAG: hypothetical protein ACRCW0_05960 [Clostridium sp.]
MEKKVVIINFGEKSKAFEAFSQMKLLYGEKKIIIEQMAVIEHNLAGKLTPKDFLDFTGEDKTAKGSLIGILVGILGGPLGVFLGWATGGIIGSHGDVKEIKNAYSVFDKTLESIQKGSTGIMAIVSEYAEEVLEKVARDLGGEITRLDYEKVEEEIKIAEETEKELKKEAKKRWFERNKE